MANLIVVCGPQAVGKMTVAESLRDKLKYNMMMNHDSIEMSDQIFGFGTPAQKEFNAFFDEKNGCLRFDADSRWLQDILAYSFVSNLRIGRNKISAMHRLPMP